MPIGCGSPPTLRKGYAPGTGCRLTPMWAPRSIRFVDSRRGRIVEGDMGRIDGATRWRRLVTAVAVVLGAAVVTQAQSNPAGASTLPAGFRDSVVLSGLTNPVV